MKRYRINIHLSDGRDIQSRVAATDEGEANC